MADHRPTRNTVDGRAYLDLQNLARKQHRPTDELHQLYALEGFLSRLTASKHADRLVLKGGVLMAAYDARRPTRDVDLHARDLPNDEAAMLQLVREVAGHPLDDGLVFDTSSAKAEIVRDEADYSGVRVTLRGRLSIAKLAFHVDINVGDPVRPAPQLIKIPKILGGDLEVTGYPIAMVHAEKIVTALERRTANTRWRDFVDIHALCRRHPANGEEVHQSIITVAEHRKVVAAPLSAALAGYPAVAQTRWAAWRRRQLLDDRLPEDFSEVLDLVTRFADPAISGEAIGLVWQPADLTWG